jgi:hypothetical protein
VVVTAPTLTDWWQLFNPGACRQSALSVNLDFTGFPQNQCFDPWTGLAAGGLAAYLTSTTIPPNPYPDPNRARVVIGAAIANPIALPAGVEFYSFQLVLSHARSDGPDACVGCGAGACLVLNEIVAVEQDGSRARLTIPIERQIIEWQCASFSHGWGCTGDEHCPTPALPTSWGQIKSLYR